MKQSLRAILSRFAIGALKREGRLPSSKMPKIERIRKRHLLKVREQRDIVEQLEKDLKHEVRIPDEEIRLEEGVLDDGSRVLLSEGLIVFFEQDGRLFPTLRAVLDGLVQVSKVTVDMGAVKFVVNGADVMRPGVTAVQDGVLEGSIVTVVDERHGKPLAIGVSLMSSEAIVAATSGKVVLSKHHVNDDLWEYGKS